MNTDQLLLEQFVNDHPQQAVIALKNFSEEDVVAFLEEEPIDVTLGVISTMSRYRAAQCLELMSIPLALTIMDSLDLRTKRSILRHCDEQFQNELLTAMDPKQAAVLKQKLSFTTGTVGYSMEPLILSFKDDLTVGESIGIVKNEKEHISSTVIVVDENGKPLGIVSLHHLLVADFDDRVADLMETEFPSFYADEPIESVQDDPGWQVYRSIPVVGRSGILIGTLDFKTLGEGESTQGERNKNLVETGNALGELYRIGLTGLLQSVSK